ncbi:MAG: PolC-type DNA polymerase III [Gemmatimonadaceae bacterium]
MELTRGMHAEPDDTLLTTRAFDYLSAGPADVVDLIGHICSLPGAPRIVAEHMAQAMFSGRSEFVRGVDGKWGLTELARARRAAGLRPSARQPVSNRLPIRRPDAYAPAVANLARMSESLRHSAFVVVDVETTGTRAYHGDRITEIAAVVVRDGEIREVYETLVNPQRPIPPFVTALTNITWAMVRNAPTFDRVAPDVMRVLEGGVFVAHNAIFDWRFVTSELSRCAGQKLLGRKLCTVKLARKVLPHLSRRSLDYLARYYGVEIRGRHRAGGDAIATAKCLVRMLSDLSQRGCHTWSELEELLATPTPPRKRRRRPSALPMPVTRDTTA